MSQIEARIATMAARYGPLSYPDVIEEALYGEGGFYTSVGAAGRNRDFLTSPETGHLFGAVVARYADRLWALLGKPDPFWFVEAGCGTGTLCRTLLDASPMCRSALRYVCVERSAAQRAAIARQVPLQPCSEILGAVEGTGDAAHPRAGQGPLVTVMADLPERVGAGLVFANELLDNLTPVVIERSSTGWSEVRVTAELTEVLVPAPEGLVVIAERRAPEAGIRARIPIARAARQWLSRARTAVAEGEVVCIDYGAPTAELADRGWPGWVRTYRGHSRGGHPLNDLGSVDVTFDVPTDQLDAVRDVSQAEWLIAAGMEDLVQEARDAWDSRSGWNLAALKARSRVGEGVTLRDPDGFGAFRVLTWSAG